MLQPDLDVLCVYGCVYILEHVYGCVYILEHSMREEGECRELVRPERGAWV